MCAVAIGGGVFYFYFSDSSRALSEPTHEEDEEGGGGRHADYAIYRAKVGTSFNLCYRSYEYV